MSTTGERFERAVAIMERLRAPGGCPWDREQSFDSIKPYTLEETYEVLEAIDNRDWDELPGELGDLLLQVLFYSEMGKEQGWFSIDDVLERLYRKLVDRHPHVFGDTKADTSADVKRNWEALKAEERRKLKERKRLSETGGASDANLIGKSEPDIESLFEKLNEETAELRQHLEEFPAPGPRSEGSGVAGSGRQVVPEDLRLRLEEEVGDLFFVLVNIARYLALDPESALRQTNRKFRRRFRWMEQRLRESGIALDRAGRDRLDMDQLESLWQQAKRQEKKP
jgi:uncharacterized protein YabN with tetrapyrrole methylase and pyrophosphatase domain